MQKDQLIYKAFPRISLIILFAVFFSALTLSLVNDAYSFVKPENSVTLEINTPHTLNEIATILQKNGIINNPFCFSLYVKSRAGEKIIDAFNGTITLDHTMSYREILNEFKNF